jgi:hypothetical protein
MIYNIDNISLFANHFHRSRRQDNRPYICRKYRIQPYPKKIKELRFRQELQIKEDLRIEQELQEFRQRWRDENRQIHKMFEAGEDDLLFPTEQGCELGKERGVFEVEDNSLLPTNPEKFKNLVLSAVDRYFDQRIYDDVMTQFTPQDIEKLVHQQVQFNDGTGGY